MDYLGRWWRNGASARVMLLYVHNAGIIRVRSAAECRFGKGHECALTSSITMWTAELDKKAKEERVCKFLNRSPPKLRAPRL